MSRCIRVSLVEVLLKIEILIPLLQQSWSIIRINVVGILPCVMLLFETFPSNLVLESVAEPLGINVLLDSPEVLIIDFDWGWRWVTMMWDHVGFDFRKDINIENIVDFPMRQEFEPVRQIR